VSDRHHTSYVRAPAGLSTGCVCMCVHVLSARCVPVQGRPCRCPQQAACWCARLTEPLPHACYCHLHSCQFRRPGVLSLSHRVYVLFVRVVPLAACCHVSGAAASVVYGILFCGWACPKCCRVAAKKLGRLPLQHVLGLGLGQHRCGCVWCCPGHSMCVVLWLARHLPRPCRVLYMTCGCLFGSCDIVQAVSASRWLLCITAIAA
jgi:hypothetical protein